jgi:hypothetical protein
MKSSCDGQAAQLTASQCGFSKHVRSMQLGGIQYFLLATIVDHRKDSSAIERPEMYATHGSNQHFDKAWDLCVEWKDNSTSWEKFGS